MCRRTCPPGVWPHRRARTDLALVRVFALRLLSFERVLLITSIASIGVFFYLSSAKDDEGWAALLVASALPAASSFWMLWSGADLCNLTRSVVVDGRGLSAFSWGSSVILAGTVSFELELFISMISLGLQLGMLWRRGPGTGFHLAFGNRGFNSGSCSQLRMVHCWAFWSQSSWQKTADKNFGKFR